MAIERLPLFSDGSSSYRITIDGVGYIFAFRYAERHDAWYVSVYLEDGTALRVGIRCANAWALNAGDPAPLMPAGIFVFVRLDDKENGTAPISLEDFPDNVALLRYSGEDIPTSPPPEELLIQKVSP